MKRIKNCALPIVSTPLRIVGRLREASRQKPPPGQNWPLCVSRRIAWRRILLHANVALSSDVPNSLKRIKNGALPLGVFVVNFLFCHSFNEVVLLGNPGGLEGSILAADILA
ncbi:hypothetical protein Q9L42_001025 [Methylomarinum sp. Ch1-1]|uniref:Uncharacterized protein n=1 Tax=Methylomarinum roseum TaxID=3067653 RepID=A0AAU7NUW9_9GAMM